MECRILECVCGAFVRETGVLCASERLGMKMAGIYIMYGAVFGVRFPVIFYMFCLHAKTHMAYRKKYKPYILKYKALVSKYVPYIFCEKRYLIFNDLQNRKNSVFPHRCAQKKSSETECTHPRKPCIVFAEPTDFTHMPLVSPKLPNAVAKTPSDAFKKTSKPYNDFLYFHLLIKTVGIFSAFPENQAK